MDKICREYNTDHERLFGAHVVWTDFKARLDALLKSLHTYPPVLHHDFVGLPFEEHFRKRVDDHRTHQERLLASREEAKRQMAEARATKIQSDARRVLGRDVDEWLSRGLVGDSGLKPEEVSAASDEGHDRMQRILFGKEREMEEQARQRMIASNKRTKARAMLTMAAGNAFATEQHAELWLNTGNPALRGARPIDYCTDDGTLAEVLLHLPKSRRR
ncbi:antitoxin Xre/MbcA/ParS toxin-binding domain-containing protein [Rhizobium sullae]|uniref:Uncharacterized protein DUF2384 n=1 Tax=Rhizobium sullae TaxID=50338 RepID=A0A4V2V9N5_RHISU|nr:antitoxin Xre/MbcA/ParS toxin-binding domain-containing protein [Rhizobium sullae]TCU17895.1 uncharacterized protein DUF2384 [Rhizobium sullae]